MDLELERKACIVTGATSGIGLAAADLLEAEGAQVLRVARGGGFEADVTEPDAAERIVAECERRFGAVDVLVNNAGSARIVSLEETTDADWDEQWQLNVMAPMRLMRTLTPPMRERGWGRIINTASAHSLVASPNKSAYVAAKHGVAGFTKTVALETARDGITVNCISPGYVWTPLVENQIPDTMKARGLTREQVMNDVLLAAQPTKQFVTPEQVAALALFLCRDEASSITGANIIMDGGWTAA